MIPSQNAIDLIKKYEGCKLEAYQDQKGIWTIGWGTTGPGIQEGLRVAQGTADAMLVGHIRELGLWLTDLVGRLLNQNQFDACTSLMYNTGTGAFRGSTLLKLLLAKKYQDAALEFTKWDHEGTSEDKGLLTRRQAEMTMFLRIVE